MMTMMMMLPDDNNGSGDDKYSCVMGQMMMMMMMHPDDNNGSGDDKYSSCAGPEGGQDVRTPPPGQLQKYSVPSNTGPDSLKFTKLPIRHSMFGHHRPASKTPFKWRFAGGSMTARL